MELHLVHSLTSVFPVDLSILIVSLQVNTLATSTLWLQAWLQAHSGYKHTLAGTVMVYHGATSRSQSDQCVSSGPQYTDCEFASQHTGYKHTLATSMATSTLWLQAHSGRYCDGLPWSYSLTSVFPVDLSILIVSLQVNTLATSTLWQVL